MFGTLVIMISSVYPESTKRKNELKDEKTFAVVDLDFLSYQKIIIA